MEIKDTRLRALHMLLAEVGNKKAELARRVKKSPAQISQWLGGYRTISEESARDIEATFPKPSRWICSAAAPTQRREHFFSGSY